MAFLESLFGDKYQKAIKPFWPIVEKINALEEGIKALSDVDLKAKTVEFKKRLEKETLEDILPEAFAVVREASRRVSGERHFDVQLIGGMIIHKGGIAEMRTGEGKTLVATLPAYLNALTGHGVHIVTVNDYLSRRDAVWMGQVYDFLGLTVGVINHESSFLYDAKHIQDKNLEVKEDQERDQLGSFKIVYDFLKPCARREAYAADITYGTNNEFGFDYLRDNIEYAEKDLRQREYNFAIVDEVDSILIDEARTPLIISAPTAESGDLYVRFADIVKSFKKDEDFTVDEKLKAIQLTDNGISKAEKALGIENIYTDAGIKYVHHLETAARAKALFEKDTDYVIKEGEIVIVDEFTGRLQPGRRWSEGLHQAIEAKEGVKIQKESRTFASITFQNYFRLYKKLAGMTGTALTSEEEFYKVYHIETFSIPTNREIQRVDKNDLIFQTENGKFQAVAKQVKELQKKGQPVLIGTVSIEKNEILSSYLSKEGVKHNVLNAKNHEKEGEIIASAGFKGGVTVATNMAGRGVDIKLGGVPFNKEKFEEVKSLGGLCVIGTERHEARRIDNQLRGRAGRQGDPGETQFYVSLEDSLMRIFASDTIKKLMGRFGLKEDEAIENSLITKSLETAQTKIEGFNFDARKHVLEYDDVLNYQRKLVYDRRRTILLGDYPTVREKLDEIILGNEELTKIVEEKIKLLGEAEFYRIAKILLLQSIDMFWVDHLEIMDYTRSSVNLRAYGQRDPLVEYKKEGLRLFKEMNDAVNDQVLKILPNIGAGAYAREEQELKETQKHMKLAGGGEENKDGSKPASASSPASEGKVGRNDPCPCGSGKKYKKCHMNGN
ncbi:MAG: preprotein translocase subunit SecA [Candidatus Paceibacterota bacterium]